MISLPWNGKDAISGLLAATHIWMLRSCLQFLEYGAPMTGLSSQGDNREKTSQLLSSDR